MRWCQTNLKDPASTGRVNSPEMNHLTVWPCGTAYCWPGSISPVELSGGKCATPRHAVGCCCINSAGSAAPDSAAIPLWSSCCAGWLKSAAPWIGRRADRTRSSYWIHPGRWWGWRRMRSNPPDIPAWNETHCSRSGSGRPGRRTCHRSSNTDSAGRSGGSGGGVPAGNAWRLCSSCCWWSWNCFSKSQSMHPDAFVVDSFQRLRWGPAAKRRPGLSPASSPSWRHQRNGTFCQQKEINNDRLFFSNFQMRNWISKKTATSPSNQMKRKNRPADTFGIDVYCFSNKHVHIDFGKPVG